jgi:hypothetical protein
MAVGYATTKLDFDNKCGRLVVAVRDSLYECVKFNNRLIDPTDITPVFLNGIGVTGDASTGDVKTARDAFFSLALLNEVMYGRQAVASPFLFFDAAQRLTGIN